MGLIEKISENEMKYQKIKNKDVFHLFQKNLKETFPLHQGVLFEIWPSVAGQWTHDFQS